MLHLSLVHADSGRPQIQYKLGKGKKQTLRLGQCTEDIAKAVKQHVREILLAKMFNRTLPLDTEIWLQGLDDSIHAKLAKHKFVEPKVPAAKVVDEATWTVARLADYCIHLWYSKKPHGSTAKPYWQTLSKLKYFFRTQCRRCGHLTSKEQACEHCGDIPEDQQDSSWEIGNITAGKVDEFANWLRYEANDGEGHKSSTFNKHIQRSRRFFRQAMRLKRIDENPFEHVPPAVDDSDDREFNVTIEIFDKLMRHEPDPMFRLVLALARFGGLRTPSEIGPLQREWCSDKSIKVHTVKLDYLPKKRWRRVPIFSPLRPYLDDVLKLPPDPSGALIYGFKITESALTSRMHRLLNRAKVEPWPKLWLNLRSTRITELEDSRLFSETALDRWFGNTKKTRKKHYNQVFKDQLEAAIAWENDRTPCESNSEAVFESH
ncbi:MAG: phage integrase SAM-like domain-containing protein [Pseudomonadota bacterium]